MSTATRPYPTVQTLIESFAGWLKHRRELNEMRRLDRTDFDRIASDLRIAPDDLEELVRDMERVCSLCHQKARCDRDLADGTAAENYHGYCGNAATLESLDRADLA